ncbi:GrpE-domain-containing protein [Fistulina hepatica ATCC 64428]|nr:GrpE-domain-containing protein [Fistulina hepatica ATCC 64428]
MSSALQIFRLSTASLSSRTFARGSAVRSATPFAAGSRRHYSEEFAEEAKDESKDSKADADKADTDKESVDKVDAEKLSPEPEKLKAKEVEVVDLTSRLRYLQADFLNLQRNAAREKEQTRDFAITRFAKDLLETVDVLSMALKSVPPEMLTPPPSSRTSSEAPESPSTTPQKTAIDYLRELYTGVDMTQRQLLQTLFKYHVKPFDPLGETFDPNRHEALYQAPIPGKTAGTIVDVQKTGYTIKDRTLRAAQVGVAQESS